MGWHLDHNLGEASRSLAGERHFTTSVDGKHLDHTRGEASRSLTSERYLNHMRERAVISTTT